MKNARAIARWILPGALEAAIESSPLLGLPMWLKHRNLLARNAALRDRHPGKRAFILCNGPSTKRQDLRPLQDEFVISVSSGYLIDGYASISPRYHCVPQITYGAMTETDVVRWFAEMHERLGSAELFLSLTERDLVERHRLFDGRTVRYLCLGRTFGAGERSIINLASVMPRVASVPIMALLVAMYLGFDRIYLLGVDHDSFHTRSYTYAFQPTVLHGKDISTNADGSIKEGNGYQELEALARLWAQYRHVKRIAEASGICIENATDGGLLDVFGRTDLEALCREN